MDFKIDLTQAILDNLNLSKIDNTKLKSEFKIDIYGNESNNLKGDITLSGLVYSEGGKSINIPELMIHIDRTLDKDHLVINSEMRENDLNYTYQKGRMSLKHKLDQCMQYFLVKQCNSFSSPAFHGSV